MALVLRNAALQKQVSLLKCFKTRTVVTSAKQNNNQAPLYMTAWCKRNDNWLTVRSMSNLGTPGQTTGTEEPDKTNPIEPESSQPAFDGLYSTMGCPCFPCGPCPCGPCGPCGPCCGNMSDCNCGRLLPPPCNTPPKCIQYMQGYYYYPYGTWFCGPYHVSTGGIPCMGPVCPGTSCGIAPPNPNLLGKCGPCCGPCCCGLLECAFCYPPTTSGMDSSKCQYNMQNSTERACNWLRGSQSYSHFCMPDTSGTSWYNSSPQWNYYTPCECTHYQSSATEEATEDVTDISKETKKTFKIPTPTKPEIIGFKEKDVTRNRPFLKPHDVLKTSE